MKTRERLGAEIILLLGLLILVLLLASSYIAISSNNHMTKYLLMNKQFFESTSEDDNAAAAAGARWVADHMQENVIDKAHPAIPPKLDNGFVPSKRMIPTGPNPLHNR